MPREKQPATIQEWFEYGRQCFHKPDGVEAVKALEKVCDMDPSYKHSDGDNPYFYLGKIYEVESRYTEAIELYTKALAVDYWDEESLIGRGSCLSVKGKYAEAADDFQKTLQIPDNKRRCPRKMLLYIIAETYRQMQEWGQAIYWGQLALNADPGNQSHRQLLDKIKARIAD